MSFSNDLLFFPTLPHPLFSRVFKTVWFWFCFVFFFYKVGVFWGVFFFSVYLSKMLLLVRNNHIKMYSRDWKFANFDLINSLLRVIKLIGFYMALLLSWLGPGIFFPWFLQVFLVLFSVFCNNLTMDVFRTPGWTSEP